MRINEYNLGHCVIIMLVILLASCSTLPKKGPDTEPPKRQFEDLVKEKKELPSSKRSPPKIMLPNVMIASDAGAGILNLLPRLE